MARTKQKQPQKSPASTGGKGRGKTARKAGKVLPLTGKSSSFGEQGRISVKRTVMASHLQHELTLLVYSRRKSQEASPLASCKCLISTARQP